MLIHVTENPLTDALRSYACADIFTDAPECADAVAQACEAMEQGADAITDLLADLMHLCDCEGVDFDHELSMATDFYGDESEARPIGE